MAKPAQEHNLSRPPRGRSPSTHSGGSSRFLCAPGTPHHPACYAGGEHGPHSRCSIKSVILTFPVKGPGCLSVLSDDNTERVGVSVKSRSAGGLESALVGVWQLIHFLGGVGAKGRPVARRWWDGHHPFCCSYLTIKTIQSHRGHFGKH